MAYNDSENATHREIIAFLQLELRSASMAYLNSFLKQRRATDKDLAEAYHEDMDKYYFRVEMLKRILISIN